MIYLLRWGRSAVEIKNELILDLFGSKTSVDFHQTTRHYNHREPQFIHKELKGSDLSTTFYVCYSSIQIDTQLAAV
jgi:hypothetical protein